jgi:GT2 family glycosyltransferase
MSGVSSPRTIAVLITYHNEGPLLRECIESVARQPSGPDEILVYDDASADPADRFVPHDAGVRIIRGAVNRGPAYGRNALIGATTCEFVHFHDADDLFAPTWARRVREALAGKEVDVVFTDLISVQDGATASASVMDLAEGLRADPDLVRFGLRGALLLPSSTSRRSLVMAIGGFRTREILPQSEDFDFHIRLAAAAGDRYAVVPESLVIQRLRSGSHSSDRRSVWTSAIAAIRLLADELPHRYRQDLSDAAARFASRLFALGEVADGRAAARFARDLGRPRFANRPAAYRLIARVLGQSAAERVGRAYRRLRPAPLRGAS